MRYILVPIEVTDYHFIFVVVWKERADYEQATQDHNDACFGDYTIVDEKDKPVPYPCAGMVNIIKGSIDAGLIAHEFLHAAFHIAKLSNNTEEEYIASLVQKMNNVFWSSVQDNPLLYEWVYEGEYAEE